MIKFPYAIVEGKTVIKIVYDSTETPLEHLPKDDNDNLLKRPFEINDTIPSEYEEDFYFLDTWLDIKPKRVIQRYISKKIDIDNLYLLKKEEINSKLDMILQMGIAHDGHMYQSDQDSVTAIASNAVEAQAATAKSNYSIGWYDSQNVEVKHDKASFITLHRKVNAHLTKMRKRARKFKDDILTLLNDQDWDGLKSYHINFLTDEDYDDIVKEVDSDKENASPL